MYSTLQKAPLINHPLQTGHAPAYLVRRMIKLLGAMSKVIIDEYGQQKFLRRLTRWKRYSSGRLGHRWRQDRLRGVLCRLLVLDVFATLILSYETVSPPIKEIMLKYRLAVFYLYG
jgi:hypothetical protein